MTISDNDILIIFRNAQEQEGKPAASARSFWGPLTDSDKEYRKPFQEDNPEYRPEHWERIINQRFGETLQEEMLKKVGGRLRLLTEAEVDFNNIPACQLIVKRYADLSLISIRARVIGYSSMQVGLDFSGIQHLADAFNNNFDTFRVFLDGFINPSFAILVGAEFAASVDHTMTVNSTFAANFNQTPTTVSNEPPPATNAPPANNTPTVREAIGDAQKRAQFWWGAVNASFIFPVLLALLVLYFTFTAMNEARTLHTSAIIDTLAQQAKLLEEDRSRMSGYNLIQEAIIRDRLQLATMTPTSAATPTGTPAPTPTP